MKKLIVLSVIALFTQLKIFSQEPQRVEGLDSIVDILNTSTKGNRYVLSDTGINSELSEIGTSFFMNKYVILSNKKRRHYETTKNEKTNTFNNNLYCVNVDSEGNLSFPLLFSSALDSKNNEGSLAFTPDQQTIYFTQETDPESGKFELFRATLASEGSKKFWSDITKIDLDNGNYSIETPSVAPDGKKLYISSNKPGGFGGYDIYEVAILENGSFGTMKNLGANVNTAEDDKYPHLTPDGKYFYFSSKGHLNIGGYDVFRSSIVNEKYLKALNLGPTLNSRKDDLAFILVNDKQGYLSTDKSGTDNFDILKFEIKNLEKGNKTFQITEKNSQLPLPNAKVVIKDEFGNIVSQTVSDNNGNIKVDINPISYNYISVEKDGYENYENDFTSENILKSPIVLQQAKPIITEDAIVIENIYFDFNKASIKPESELSLNKIKMVLEEHPEFKIAINAHTDTKGSDRYNLQLSDKRAKSAYNYLIKNGVAPEKLTSKGYGESQPLKKCTSCTSEEDQANRRIEFKIIKQLNQI
ncbi:hypothetical protein DI487_09190 [Flavobacterium sediminis]|uniref:OmpA-like domain-containing protein n=1 Tax=Flavobacterium sediminis TaxID=2201181 RepID=A0A2U8QV60_9FLAO|nr:OmpA family protein [Flavobacterium sediminis]AWM14013.1 hypothetical protein DI487_09190 [Flavobacterium sediminis]